ncbi:hypothetical protein WN55_03875 [Dufourea novaeangliae]|uniref:Uncharacterized protein n=1 Tax=Dufourea novaeangliae TaxID=178035 RepID=A0A154NYZ2_DUFNO|nr:hypothetical protein WN55_03875 [Dufourea novaeangliae]
MPVSCGGVARQDTLRVVIHDIFVCEVNDRYAISLTHFTQRCHMPARSCPPVSLAGAEFPITVLYCDK